ncbi:hypothetical protein [Bacteroides acidifaciens]|uniref:hypothetical protein n=1 Tax=Bacteroides acidifaciens TaxID=85831 RepID=UPI002557F39F|nr:hypothetical protein [Bacteroides acidifaciens]
MTMNKWQKIFVCYYRFQERIGNGDLPVFISMGMILFALFLYLFSVTTVVLFSFGNILGLSVLFGLKKLTLFNIMLCCLLGAVFYLKYLRGDRLNDTLSIEISRTDKFYAAVFLIGSIFSICCVFIFMWAVNNGFILEGGKQ